MRVLHIHDGGRLAAHTAIVLKSMDIALDAARSVEHATEALSTSAFDLVIVDIDELKSDVSVSL